MATPRTTRRTTNEPEDARARMLSLYEPFRYLEADHNGEYLCVAPNGKYVVGSDEIATADEALRQFGPGFTMFRIGQITMGRTGWQSTYL